MTSETINGLHSCKPGNEPIVGQVKTFTVEQRTSRNGKPWLKIKSAPADQGGTPYQVLSAEQTAFTDSYGNISFNLEIEPQLYDPATTKPLGGGGENTQKPVQAASSPPQNLPAHAPQAPPARSYAGDGIYVLDQRQRAIIRQHSQSMALEVLKLKVTLNELTVEDLTPAKLRSLADYFDQDVLGAAQ